MSSLPGSTAQRSPTKDQVLNESVLAHENKRKSRQELDEYIYQDI